MQGRYSLVQLLLFSVDVPFLVLATIFPAFVENISSTHMSLLHPYLSHSYLCHEKVFILSLSWKRICCIHVFVMRKYLSHPCLCHANIFVTRMPLILKSLTRSCVCLCLCHSCVFVICLCCENVLVMHIFVISMWFPSICLTCIRQSLYFSDYG